MMKFVTQSSLVSKDNCVSHSRVNHSKVGQLRLNRNIHHELIARSRFQKGDRVQFGNDSIGRVLGHDVCEIDGEPVLTLIVLLEPEYRCNRWNPLETWIETEQIRRSS